MVAAKSQQRKRGLVRAEIGLVGGDLYELLSNPIYLGN